MKKNYQLLAHKIVEKHHLGKFVQILLDYWEKNPPTIGHGFEHVVRVAVEAYELGELNRYETPQDLFVGGLFHDIFRPAEGIDGEEDQKYGAKVVETLFKQNKISEELSTKVIGAILSHDNWIGKTDAPVYDLILSTADKTAHNIRLTYNYIFASNQYLQAQNKPVKYDNFLIPLYGFNKYQQRAWDVFMKHRIKGTERAIESYLNINKAAINNYLKDPAGKTFFKYIERLANKTIKVDRILLQSFGRDKKSIARIMKSYFN